MSLIIGHVNLSQSWGEEPCAPPSPVQVLVTSICSLNLNICFLSCKILLAWPVFEKVTAFFLCSAVHSLHFCHILWQKSK